MNRRYLIPLLGLALGLSSLSLKVGTEIVVPVGGGRGPIMVSGLGPSEAVWSLPAEEIADSRSDFYFRQIESRASAVTIPLLATGSFSVSLRMDTTVRTEVDIVQAGRVVGGAAISPGPWMTHPVAAGFVPGPAEFEMRYLDAPLVRRSDPENFRRYLDSITLRSDEGFRLPWSSRLAGALLLILLIVAAQKEAPGPTPLVLAMIGPAILALLSRHDPVALSLALPRLLIFVCLGATLIALLARLLKIGHEATARLALMGSAMIFAYGFLSFLPNHSPADLDIHIWRTKDLAGVPFSYEAWLRYGSHYPTPSQIQGAATEALGEGPAIPYSPMPYLLFYVGHALGLDLHWSMNAIEATSLALLLPFVYAFGLAASSNLGGLLAAALMALDLATVHHLGRVHSPAVVGGALGLACLLALGLALPRLHEPGRWKVPALLLGLGTLGYTSTALFYGLFGIALLLLIAFSADRRLLGPVTLALVAGGGVSLALFYGHYVPDLVRGGGHPGLLSDPFPGRTFFIFHNESRQSLRLWRLGLFLPFLAALPAAVMVMRKASSLTRSFLFAWVGAWAGIMLLKEPWAFPQPLRWAKEDFYVAPSLALLIAIAIARIESRPLRLVLSVVTLAAAAFLRVRDYGFHADTLRFLR